MFDKIYIIGHKSPDLDSVAGPIAYARLKNELEKTDRYIPVISEPINKETEYVLKKFGFDVPEILIDATDKELILIDHNEFIQSVQGIENAKILEIIDHHKVDFKYSDPIKITVKPWGASCTIITQMFLDNNIEIEKNLAGLVLSAILVDTVITKSPTCIEKDIEMIEKLSSIAGIESWQDFGMEIFKVRGNVGKLSDIEIIKSDFKDFNFSAGKFGIGQIETIDLGDFESREEKLLDELDRLRKDGGYHTTILFITDILKEGSKFFISTSDQENLEKALETKFENNKSYIAGVLSRKKQVAPKLTEIFDK